MTARYDAPNLIAKAANEFFRLLAELGISVAGTRAIRVRGRKTGKRRGVVINLLTVDGRQFLVSPRRQYAMGPQCQGCGRSRPGSPVAQSYRPHQRACRRRQAGAAQALPEAVVLGGQGARWRTDAGFERR